MLWSITTLNVYIVRYFASNVVISAFPLLRIEIEQFDYRLCNKFNRTIVNIEIWILDFDEHL